MLNSESVDATFLGLAHNLMKRKDLPAPIAHARKMVRQYLAECLTISARSMDYSSAKYYSAPDNYTKYVQEAIEVTVNLVFSDYTTNDYNEAESSLEVTEVKNVPGTIPAQTHRFSGLDIDE